MYTNSNKLNLKFTSYTANILVCLYVDYGRQHFILVSFGNDITSLPGSNRAFFSFCHCLESVSAYIHDKCRRAQSERDNMWHIICDLNHYISLCCTYCYSSTYIQNAAVHDQWKSSIDDHFTLNTVHCTLWTYQ
jgi:hypothetical protein